jgi:hypothetical protein
MEYLKWSKFTNEMIKDRSQKLNTTKGITFKSEEIK